MSDVSVSSLARVTDFRRLLVAQSISGFGDWLATVALMALVLDLTGSPTAVGAMLALRLGPGTIAGPLLARAAWRWNRKRTMLAMDAARICIVLAIPLVAEVWWVLVWVFLLELATLLYIPTRDAAVPDLLENPTQLELANGLVLAGTYGTLLAGAGVFAVYAALVDPGAAVPGGRFAPIFWADALTFAASFVLIRRISAIDGEGIDPADAPRFRHAWRLPVVRAALLPIMAVAFGLGTVFSLGIVFVREVLGAGDAQFAILIVLFAAGAVVGLGLVRLRPTTDHLATMRIGVLVLGAIFVIMGAAPGLFLTFGAAVAFGTAAVVTIVSAVSGLQTALDGTARVLAFAAFHIGVRVALAVGAVVSGAAAEVLERAGLGSPVRSVMSGAGLFVILAVALVWNRLRPAHADAPVPRPAD